MTIDLNRARRETPGCTTVAHFNNAGAGLMPAPVLDATIGHLRLEAEIGGYEAHDRQSALLDDLYDSAATLVNCRASEIAFVENATRAWDMAFYSLDFKPGDRILTAKAEYVSNYIAYLQVSRKTGAVVEVVDNDNHGQISIAALEAMMDDRVKLISITHVPTNGGLVNPAAAVGRVARAAGVTYLLDACQSVGQMPIDVEAIGCDMLSATGRKYLRGPRGTGFLYVRQSLAYQLEPVFLDLRAAEWVADDRYDVVPGARRFENWESNVAGKIGLGVAMDYALGWGLDAIRDRVVGLADGLRRRLGAMAGVTVRDLGVERCGIVSFSMAGHGAKAIAVAAAKQAINVSVSSVSSTRLDMADRAPDGVVRASVHYYNNDEEIDRLCAVVEGLA
ncbi:MAG: aminotransferase class V-fold PLP-dependent enzyme [Pseudomonadota bacterium]|nr:aminotransferase class V-fold PLP-dependent enzyme [Pseudomonadota bacterium]